MNKRCDLCQHWSYTYPDDMGVCTAESDHPNGLGLGVETTDGKFLTSCDTRCDDWKSDGTEKAEEVRLILAR